MSARESQTVGTAQLDFDKLRRNRIPIAVDIASGVLFFVVAKLTDLTTAAFVGAGVGIGLFVLQRVLRVDLLGGLALFGIAMMLVSAALAFAYADDEVVKMRSTAVGLVAAVCFLTDGAFGGRYLGERMSRYLVYADVIPRRLSFGIGATGLVMAALNWLVARFFSTDVWLLYTTFGDLFVTMALFVLMLSWARGRWPAPRKAQSS